MSEEIKLLSEILEDYENGNIELNKTARKCYLNEDHKKKNIINWIHDDEIQGQLYLRNLSRSTAKRDLLRKL